MTRTSEEPAGPSGAVSPESTVSPENKGRLRSVVERRLRATSVDERRRASRAATQALEVLLRQLLSDVPPTATVAVFSPTPLEPSPVEGALAAVGPDRLAWPRVLGPRLHFHLASPTSLAPGELGISEPAADSPIVTPAVVVVPGRAFDRTGARLGRGRGYYDRALESLPADTRLVGFCFALQVVDRVPVEDHDRHVEWLVTEEGAVRCHAAESSTARSRTSD